MKNIKLRIILIILIPIVVTLILVLFFMNHLTSEEKVAYDIVAKYQKSLKDPQSMTLCGDIISIDSTKIKDDSDYIYTYTYFTIFLNDESNNQIKHTVMFENDRYVGYYAKTSFSDMTDEEFLDYISCETPLMMYEKEGENVVNFEGIFSLTVVDSRKIARKLHCKYMDDE